MDLYEQFLHFAGRAGVDVIPYPIAVAPAATLRLRGQYAVFFDPVLMRRLPQAERNEVLAHEQGHCATGALHKLSSPYDLIEKHEQTADRWAFEHYLPFDELRAAMRMGLTEPWEMAEWYDFPEEFIRRALAYYREAKGLSFDGPEAE